MKKYQLMAPGPTPVPSEVLLAMAQPILHHRTPEYEALFVEVRAGLKRLLQTSQDVIPLACSGTGAMEAAVVNTLSAGDTVAGRERRQVRRALARDLCRAFGVDVVELKAPYGETVPRRARGRGAEDAPGHQGRARAAQRDLHRRAPRRARLRRRHARHRRHPDRRRGLEPRHRRPPDGRLGRGRGRGRLAEGADAAARPRLLRAEREGVGQEQDVQAAEATTSTSPRSGRRSPRTRRTSRRPCSIVVGLRTVIQMLEREGLANVFKRHDRLARATRAGVEALGLASLLPRPRRARR